MESDDAEVRLELSDSDRQEIETLIEAQSLVLGREALTEQARRVLRSKSEAFHFLQRSRGQVTAYAQGSANGHALSVEFLGDFTTPPLLDAVRDTARKSQVGLALWLHGVTPDSAPPGKGFERARMLRRLSRNLPGPPTPASPEGLEIRTFQPGSDDQQWLALNAAAFSDHPDQGEMTLLDLRERMEESWFAPNDFLVAEREGELVAFCWTKMHRDPWGQVGEIYVIGVSPSESGHGLGRLLLYAGLNLMVERGMRAAMLYVEDDNVPARALYDAEGFTTQWCDVCWITDSP